MNTLRETRYLSRLVIVDCEATGPCPSRGRLTEVGAVHFTSRASFHWRCDEDEGLGFKRFAEWLAQVVADGSPIFCSDNPAFDWQWVNDSFHRLTKDNPFGFSARRIGDFYAGLTADFSNANAWKRLRLTRHTHHPVDDAMGNAEALERMLKGHRAK